MSQTTVAAHPATTTKRSVGKTLDGRVYELFFTSLPQDGFLAADILDVYFGRGGFESVHSGWFWSLLSREQWFLTIMAMLYTHDDAHADKTPGLLLLVAHPVGLSSKTGKIVPASPC